MRRASIVITIVFLFTNLATATSSSAEPVKIRVGWIFAPASLGPLMFATPLGASHEGKSYIFEPVHFASTAVEVTPLASGDLDVADLSVPAIGSAIANAHIDDLRIFGDEIQDGVGGYESTSGFRVLKDGPIKKVEDLKGKVVAVLTLGSATDMEVRLMLRHHGLEDKRDFSLIEAQFPNMKSLLFTQKADMVSLAAPYSMDPELVAGSRVLFTATDAFGPIQLTALEARAGFLEKNHAAMVDFMEDVIRSVRWYMNPANHAAAVALVAAFNKQKPENIDWLFTKQDTYRNLNGEPNLDAIQGNLNSMQELGFLPAKIDVHKYADLSIAREAAARFK